MKRKLDLLVIKTDSFDTESFIGDSIKYSKNSLVLLISFKGEISVAYAPKKNNYGKKNWKYSLQNNKLCVSGILSFFLFIILISIILTAIFFKYRVRVVIIENTYAAIIAGLYRKLGRSKKSFYIPGDWLASGRRTSGASNIFNNYIFPVCDFISCKLNDVVLDHNEKITKARYKYWGKEVSKNIKQYKYWLNQVKVRTNYYQKEKKKTICFIGNITEIYSFDIILNSLKKLNHQYDIRLKIIGPKSNMLRKIENKAKFMKIDHFVEFAGYVDRDDLPSKISDCFCGINIITDKNSHSNFSIPGKLIYYLSSLIPIIATKNNGPFTSVISNHKIGLIIDADVKSFTEAVVDIYVNQKYYVERMNGLINSLPTGNSFENIFRA
jgi:glycosyltransferase involved in cell wall biosynthesis